MLSWVWKLFGSQRSVAGVAKKLGVVALLYFIQGAPAAILWEVLPVYFRINGVSLRAIGGLRLLELALFAQSVSGRRWCIATAIGAFGSWRACSASLRCCSLCRL